MSWPTLLAFLAQRGDVVSCFSTGFSIKGSHVVYPKPHNVQLLRCGCFPIDVEDVELWACWMYLLEVSSYLEETL